MDPRSPLAALIIIPIGFLFLFGTYYYCIRVLDRQHIEAHLQHQQSLLPV